MMDKVKEFIFLSYKPESQMPEYFKDCAITANVMLRVDGNLWQLLYLNNGYTLSFGSEWVNFFKQLGDFLGDEVDKCEDKFVKLMIKLTSYTVIWNKQDWLDLMGEICEIGTKEFRETYPELNFKPFELKQPFDIIEI